MLLWIHDDRSVRVRACTFPPTMKEPERIKKKHKINQHYYYDIAWHQILVYVECTRIYRRVVHEVRVRMSDDKYLHLFLIDDRTHDGRYTRNNTDCTVSIADLSARARARDCVCWPTRSACTHNARLSFPSFYDRWRSLTHTAFGCLFTIFTSDECGFVSTTQCCRIQVSEWKVVARNYAMRNAK